MMQFARQTNPALSEGACLHLKSPTDDMTNAGMPVNMHAVHRTAFLVVDLCLSSSIG
ncbi:hypothetical protein EMIT0P12_80153 [Pseudomonas sp. IT-P12]